MKVLCSWATLVHQFKTCPLNLLEWASLIRTHLYFWFLFYHCQMSTFLQLRGTQNRFVLPSQQSFRSILRCFSSFSNELRYTVCHLLFQSELPSMTEHFLTQHSIFQAFFLLKYKVVEVMWWWILVESYIYYIAFVPTLFKLSSSGNRQRSSFVVPVGPTCEDESGGIECLETSSSEVDSWSLGDPVRSSFVRKAH